MDLIELSTVRAKFIPVTLQWVAVDETVELWFVDVQARRRSFLAFAVEPGPLVAVLRGIPYPAPATGAGVCGVATAEKAAVAVASVRDLDVTTPWSW